MYSVERGEDSERIPVWLKAVPKTDGMDCVERQFISSANLQAQGPHNELSNSESAICSELAQRPGLSTNLVHLLGNLICTDDQC
jgi:hypothetical protein